MPGRAAKEYRLPSNLNEFQMEFYIHLIEWKWEHVTKDPGEARGRKYDAILPTRYSEQQQWPHLYPAIQPKLVSHRAKNDFRIHRHFYHMASSQAANINLFLPILHHPDANLIFSMINKDFVSLATDFLDNGYCIEYWGGNFEPSDGNSEGKGPLGDKSKMAGTDADIAIAYRNREGQVCLWLIEHKLTEKEFTKCGGCKSKGRLPSHNCNNDFAEIFEVPTNCYYHDRCKYNYWTITKRNKEFFPNHDMFTGCPFRGGMNQLWRNHLLALSLEQDQAQPYQKVVFSVVRHPDNNHLSKTMDDYKKLIGNNPSFFDFTSLDIIVAAGRIGSPELDAWSQWYKRLYRLG